MDKRNKYLMLDTGTAFGINEKHKSYLQEHFTVIDQYDLAQTKLDDYHCLAISRYVDQEFLMTQKEKIKEFLNQKKIVTFCGHIFCDWLPGTSHFIPKEITNFLDYTVSIAKPHPIFEGVLPDDMTFSKGVAGFFAKGHHPVPEGAEVLLTLPDQEPITYIDRHSTKGTIFVHGGKDLFINKNQNNSTNRISDQLIQWVQDEYSMLQKGSVTA